MGLCGQSVGRVIIVNVKSQNSIQIRLCGISGQAYYFALFRLFLTCSFLTNFKIPKIRPWWRSVLIVRRSDQEPLYPSTVVNATMHSRSKIRMVAAAWLFLCWCLPSNAFAFHSTSSSTVRLIASVRHSARLVLPQQQSSSVFLAAVSDENDGQHLKTKAERLRQEIDSFEQEKKAVAQKERDAKEAQERAKQALQERYAADVPILKPDGSTVNERCDFQPRFPHGKSFIIVCEADLPLGIVLGECEDFTGTVVVDEVADESNGQAAGIQVGDLLRAATACRMEMETPAWQLIAGGIGIPKTKRFMYSVDNRAFEEVMNAVSSNRLDPQNRPVLLVVERQE